MQKVQAVEHLDGPPLEIAAARQVFTEAILRSLHALPGQQGLLPARQRQGASLGDLATDLVDCPDALGDRFIDLGLQAVLYRPVAGTEVTQRPYRHHVDVRTAVEMSEAAVSLVTAAAEFA